MTYTELISRGFHIFPILPGGKAPYAGSWKDYITNDASKAEQMQAGVLRIPSTTVQGVPVEVDFSGCNWAVATGPSDLVVIDIDTKDGKDGRPYWKQLTEANGLPPNTLIVRTPSGGYHLIFSGKCKMGTDCLAGTGIDIRSHGSYIVAPGQRTVKGPKTCEGVYEIVQDLPVAPCPQWVVDKQGLPMEREAIVAVPGMEMTEAQRTELVAALDTIEAENYDALLYTGMEIHNAYPGPDGLEVWIDWCQAKFSDHDSATCEYKWGSFTHGEGSRTIASLFHAARENGWTGVKAADLDWGSTMPYVAPTPTRLGLITAVMDWDFNEDDLPVREWLLARRYLKRFVTGIIAPGGVGKSTLSLIDSISIAVGKDLLTGANVEQGNVWFHNAEDPIEETRGRVAAVCRYFKIDRKILNGKLFVTSGRELNIRVATKVNGRAETNWAEVGRIQEFVDTNHIVLATFDPMISIHNIEENSNEEIQRVMDALNAIAETCNCGICVVHHTRKLNGADGAGDMDAGRGGSAFAAACRSVFTLTKMDDDSAKSFGVDPERKNWYVRLADAKANLAPPLDRQIWFERESVRLGNGDDYGILRHSELRVVEKVDPKVEENEFVLAVAVRDFSDGKVRAVSELVRDVTTEPDWMGKGPDSLRKRVIHGADMVTADSSFALRVINDSNLVPGNSSHGFRIEGLR